jgi:hypothetical protein
MSEHNPENERQDPAEQYRTDESVETETQEDPEVVVPAEPAPIEVTPGTPDNSVGSEDSDQN